MHSRRGALKDTSTPIVQKRETSFAALFHAAAGVKQGGKSVWARRLTPSGLKWLIGFALCFAHKRFHTWCHLNVTSICLYVLQYCVPQILYCSSDNFFRKCRNWSFHPGNLDLIQWILVMLCAFENSRGQNLWSSVFRQYRKGRSMNFFRMEHIGGDSRVCYTNDMEWAGIEPGQCDIGTRISLFDESCHSILKVWEINLLKNGVKWTITPPDVSPKSVAAADAGCSYFLHWLLQPIRYRLWHREAPNALRYSQSAWRDGRYLESLVTNAVGKLHHLSFSELNQECPCIVEINIISKRGNSTL